MIEVNKIYNIDCLFGMEEIKDGSVDMILCDLPYGTTQNKWDVIIPFNILWKQYERIIKNNGVIILTANGMFTADLIYSNKKMWKYNLIWEKTTPTGFLNANRMPLRVHEDICVFYKKSPIYNPQKSNGHKRKVVKASHKINCKEPSSYGNHGLTTYDSTERYPVSVLKFATDKQKNALHPTQKPVALFEYLIKTYTNEGALVLDNCIGSGTTAIACINTNRNFLGFEISKEYCQIANDRINQILQGKC